MQRQITWKDDRGQICKQLADATDIEKNDQEVKDEEPTCTKDLWYLRLLFQVVKEGELGQLRIKLLKIFVGRRRIHGENKISKRDCFVYKRRSDLAAINIFIYV